MSIQSRAKDTTLLIGEHFISHKICVYNGVLLGIELRRQLSISSNGTPSFPKINVNDPLRIIPLDSPNQLLVTAKKGQEIIEIFCEEITKYPQGTTFNNLTSDLFYISRSSYPEFTQIDCVMEIEVYKGYFVDDELRSRIALIKKCTFPQLKITDNISGDSPYFFISKVYTGKQIRIGIVTTSIKSMRSDHDGWWICDYETTTYTAVQHAATRKRIDECMSELIDFFNTTPNQKDKNYHAKFEIEDWKVALEQIKSAYWQIEVKSEKYEDYPSWEEVRERLSWRY